MAFVGFVRIPAPAILPSAIPPPTIQFIRKQRYSHSSSLSCTANNHNNVSRQASRKSVPTYVRSSSKSKRPSPEDSLLRVIESEIKLVKETDDFYVVDPSSGPTNFPFKIEDNPGQQMILLTREYKGETITVEVYTQDEDDDEDEVEDEVEDEDLDLDEDEKKGEEEDDGHETEDDEDDLDDFYQPSMSLVVRVKKASTPFLKFGCTAYPDEIGIDYLSIMDQENPQKDDIAYEGPNIANLAENLQVALHKYLEIRGLNKRTASFLHEYMTNKDRQEYTLWLKNLKKFIEQ